MSLSICVIMASGWKALDDGDDVIDKLSLNLRLKCFVGSYNEGKLGLRRRIEMRNRRGFSAHVYVGSGSDGPLRRIHGYGYGVLKD
ncbi:hypothetical protein Tco_0158940 [Tanacetum coccineum]